MARSRNIKPNFFKNYDLADCGAYAQLLFAGLWCLADRDGLLENKPRLIKAELFPYYDVDINGELTKLQRLKFVELYNENGIDVIEIINFAKHQSPHSTEKKSELPKRTGKSVSLCIEKEKSITMDSPLDNDGKSPDSLLLIPSSLNPDSLIPECGKESVAKAPTAYADLLSDVPLQIVEDWKALRKAKKAPITKTVVEGAISEAAKAGMSLTDFLAEWCSRGSQGLKAEWLTSTKSANYEPPYAKYMREKMERISPDIAAKNPNKPIKKIDPNEFLRTIEAQNVVRIS